MVSLWLGVFVEYTMQSGNDMVTHYILILVAIPKQIFGQKLLSVVTMSAGYGRLEKTKMGMVRFGGVIDKSRHIDFLGGFLEVVYLTECMCYTVAIIQVVLIRLIYFLGLLRITPLIGISKSDKLEERSVILLSFLS